MAPKSFTLPTQNIRSAPTMAPSDVNSATNRRDKITFIMEAQLSPGTNAPWRARGDVEAVSIWKRRTHDYRAVDRPCRAVDGHALVRMVFRRGTFSAFA